MKCKFEHDGYCCNSGSWRFKDTCCPNVCGHAVPMTHGDAFRTSTDEELAEFLSKTISIMDCPRMVWDLSEQGLKYKDSWMKWLKSPVK